MKRLKILMLTRLFPSSAQPTLGTFCLERARALAQVADVRVMVPTPYFPSWIKISKQWSVWSEVEREGTLEEGIRTTYPRYFLVPKLGTFLQGISISHCAYQNYLSDYEDWVPDIIDGHFAFPDGYAAVNLATKIGCKSVVTCHGADLRVYPGLMFVDKMLAQTFQRAGRVISVSSDLMKRSIALGCPPENARFLTNGVDPAKFSLRAKSECRKRLNLPLDRKIGVYVGFLIDRKNQSLVIQSIAEIRKRGLVPPLIVLVGDGPNLQRLQHEVQVLRLEQDVFFAGQKAHDEVPVWMGASDWLILSSDYEGWATVYFEAMACGRPVLTSNVSSAKDAICKPEYGCVVDPCTSEAFASALLDASSREYDEHLIRQYAEEHSWEKWAKSAMLIFDEIGSTSPIQHQ